MRVATHSRTFLLFAAFLMVAGLPCPVTRAQAVAQSSLPVAPSASGEVLKRAAADLQHGHSQAALDELDVLAGISPQAAGLNRMRGTALYALDRFADAERAYAKAIAQNPQDSESIQMQALALFRLGRPAEAIPLLEQAHAPGAQTKVDPSYLLALCYLDTRRFEDARRAFAAQYLLPPESAAAYLVAARMLLRREFVPEANSFAERAVQLDPRMPLAYELLGEIALAQNRADEAITYLEQERTRNPLEPTTYERLGDAWERKGQYMQAEQVLQQAILLEPNATGPYILLGRAHLKQGDPTGAMPFLQKAEGMDPANFMTHNLLAQTYRALGRPEDATREVTLTEQTQATAVPRSVAQR